MEIDELAYQVVPGFEGLDESTFTAKYDDEVGNLFQEVESKSFKANVPPLGTCQVRVLVGGLVILKARRSKYYLYETKARVDERENLRRWAEYARGCWTKRVPNEPGIWATRDLAGFRGPDKKFEVHAGKLIEVGGGFVGNGKVTEWRGEFWSMAMPPLPGAL